MLGCLHRTCESVKVAVSMFKRRVWELVCAFVSRFEIDQRLWALN